MLIPTGSVVSGCRVCVNLGSINALSATTLKTILTNERTEKTDSVFARMSFVIQMAATPEMYSVDAKQRVVCCTVQIPFDTTGVIGVGATAATNDNLWH